MPHVLPAACTVDGWHQHAPPRTAADIWCWPWRTADPLLLVLCLTGAVNNLHTVLPCSMFTLSTLLVCICSTCRHCPIGVGPRMLVLPGFGLAVTEHAGPARCCGHAATNTALLLVHAAHAANVHLLHCQAGSCLGGAVDG